MAFPLLLPILFTVGSAVANTIAANQQAKARDNAMAAERIRQSGLDREAQALNARSQDRYEDFEGRQGEKSKKLGDYFATAQPQADALNASAASVMPTATNDIVTREMAKKSADASRFTNQQAGALGNLRSFGDLLGDTSRMQGRDASLIGQIGGFKRGSSNVLPLELEAAAQKGGGLRFLGDVLGGLGSIGMTSALTGGSGLAGLFGAGAPASALTTTAVAPAAAGTVVRSTPGLYPLASGVY